MGRVEVGSVCGKGVFPISFKTEVAPWLRDGDSSRWVIGFELSPR